MITKLSIRARFLIAPLVGAFLAIILYAVGLGTIKSHDKILKDLQQENLPQITALHQMTLSLAEVHNTISIILLMTTLHGDEEVAYLQGRLALDKVHDLEATLKRTLPAGALTELRAVNVERIINLFSEYRQVMIHAVEFSTVNSDSGIKELATAASTLLRLNAALEMLADDYVHDVTLASHKIDETLESLKWINMIAGILILSMLLIPIYLSRRLSYECGSHQREHDQICWRGF